MDNIPVGQYVQAYWDMKQDQDEALLAELTLLDKTNTYRYRACLARIQARERVEEKRLRSSSTNPPASSS